MCLPAGNRTEEGASFPTAVPGADYQIIKLSPGERPETVVREDAVPCRSGDGDDRRGGM